MIKDRQELEDVLNLIIKDHSNDNKVISKISEQLGKKGIPLGKVGGLFTQANPLNYLSEIELCLFTKYLFDATREYKIHPDKFFSQQELLYALDYEFPIREKTNKIVLHNVDQINEFQWICTKETYQNVANIFENGLITYNPRTQRQPLKRKVAGRIIETINIDNKKIAEIKREMLNNTFFTNAISLNIRRTTDTKPFRYDKEKRTLTIIVNEGVHIDAVDGFHRLGGILKCTQERPDIDRVTSIYIYWLTEKRARAVIRQENKATPIQEEYLDVMDTSDKNMEVAKAIGQTEDKNEMYCKVGLDSNELRQEGKFVTYETLSKTINHIYDVKTFVQGEEIQGFLTQLFNIIIGQNYQAFNEDLDSTKKNTYLASNNTFIGYIALGEELRQKYPDDWKDKLIEILKKIDLNKPNEFLKKDVGLENNINLSTIKRIAEYFKSLA